MSTNTESLPVLYSSLYSKEDVPDSIAAISNQNASLEMNMSKKRGPIVDKVSVERSSSDENQYFPDLEDDISEEKPKKYGRKLGENEPQSKRKAQNRAAQRAFRKRKEDHLKTLETQVVSLQQLNSTTNVENDELKRRVKQLEDELVNTRKGSFTFEMNMQHRDPAVLSAPNNMYAPAADQYESSAYDTTPLTQNNSNSSSNQDSTSAKSNQYGVPGLVESNSSMRGTLSPETPVSSDSPQQQLQPHERKRNSASLSPYQDDFFIHHNPSMDGKQFCQKLSSACGSIACSMLTNNTPHRASVDILGDVGQKDGPLDFVETSTDPKSLGSKKPALKPFSKSWYPDETSKFEASKNMAELAGNDLPDYDTIFEPNSNINNAQNYEGDAVADLFSTWREPTENLDKDYFNDEGDTDSMFRTYFRDVDEDQGDDFPIFGVGDNTLNSLNFFNEQKAFANQGDIKKDVSVDLRSVPPEYTNIDLSYISHAAASDGGKVQDKQPSNGTAQDGEVNAEDEVVPFKEENYIKCPEIWSKIMSHPNFSQIDIDDLCSKLKQKAKCSASGVVLDQQEVDQTLGKL
ncbi:DNA-binding transcription factor, oxidative stress-responsive Pap1/Caf3 [Schizosaccharomyces osmophilus]|uniref:DNA-binding transcription factor, oxidative stress-responsive Pap1/Caf3 n=1 Tax=Schizosaccharomyces osmophilus TaxID=2545709 RepID=A0AAE9WDN6_9SCHI|nr:DNA-binding transcription factor, oxidative stress-responsive Pap1/Caf3 [Schizosaccharomyces osmophilus]WBW74295.1 DNA-binding transcription factor, oxidative stress-responsive Pap1/Caf3 [Schizosaccharomyces osmophilus]